jgi:hypothetical protein
MSALTRFKFEGACTRIDQFFNSLAHGYGHRKSLSGLGPSFDVVDLVNHSTHDEKFRILAELRLLGADASIRFLADLHASKNSPLNVNPHHKGMPQWGGECRTIEFLQDRSAAAVVHPDAPVNDDL